VELFAEIRRDARVDGLSIRERTKLTYLSDLAGFDRAARS
jgi:hypothetical protein